jgi:nucleotide-binding universal stress UspA family protein
MIKTILVAVAGTEQTRPALDTGVTLGLALSAHVECLKVHPDPAEVAAQAAKVNKASDMVVADMTQTLREGEAQRTRSAREAFDRVCDREKVAFADRPGTVRGASASWREQTGYEVEQVTARARVHDLLIVEHPSGGGGFLPLAAGAILFGSGRPMLVAPPRRRNSLTGTIVLAWKDCPQAARALSAALPVLSKAAEVLVLGVNEAPQRREELNVSLDDVVAYLGWHGIGARRSVVEATEVPAVESLLAAAHGAGADMLVMGGYGHSRLREFIFGGFTRRVLNGVSVPLFLAH